MSSGEFALQAKGLKKTYKAMGPSPAKEALKGIDLAVPRGSIFGLLGPNGAGKSTFINILAGMVMKSGGTAEIWGFDIDANPRQARASIGIVPQELSIDPFFTPGEIMELQAGMYGVPKSQRRTLEILTAMGLDDKLDAYARTLSGGMRRRLLVAKALVHNPPVLVLDEPTAGVDIELRRQLWDYVVELNRAGVTIVLTTHYLEEAETLCDRIAIINKGQVIAAKTKDDLLASAGQKTLHLTLTSPPPQVLPATLKALGAHLHPQREGQLSISFDPATINAIDILQAVQATGCVVSDISTAEPDLEDVFLSLTK